MAKKSNCKKNRTSKDRAIAMATTKRNKIERVWREVRQNPDNDQAIQKLLDLIHPMTAAQFIASREGK